MQRSVKPVTRGLRNLNQSPQAGKLAPTKPNGAPDQPMTGRHAPSYDEVSTEAPPPPTSSIPEGTSFTGRHSRSADGREFSSMYSLEKPPPLDPPTGVEEIMGWSLATAIWRDHLPERLLGMECNACQEAWPCNAWDIANDLITQCCERAQVEVQPQ